MKFIAKHNVSLDKFNKLKTCGIDAKIRLLSGDVSPFLSSWYVFDNDYTDIVNANFTGPEDFERFEKILLSNIVLVGYNPGKMSVMTPANWFFHQRYDKNQKPVKLMSEQNFEKYHSIYEMPFYGAYVTDIIKFQSDDFLLYNEGASDKVTQKLSEEKDIKSFNFQLFAREMELLSGDEDIFFIPMGKQAFDLVQEFIELQKTKKYQSISSPILHYSPQNQARWNNGSWDKVFEQQKNELNEKIQF